MSIKSSQPCCPLFLLSSKFLSLRVFSNKLAIHNRWPKYWSFSISPSNEYLGLISFRIDCFDLLAVQKTLKSLLQHILKASVLCCSAFFMAQLSHQYMTTGKTIALLYTPLSMKWCLCFLTYCLSLSLLYFWGESTSELLYQVSFG